MEKITFDTDDGTVDLCIIEQTMLAGTNYILVSDDPDSEEGVCLILKDTSMSEEEIASYELVEDENELESVAKIFAELLDDFDLEV